MNNLNYKITLSKEELQLCKEFSKNVNTTFYATRNQWDVIKRESDAFVGKAGEIVVYNYLKPKYPNISYPDFKIYKTKEKSWDFDLKDLSFNLHVKTQEILQGNKYGISWIFQNTDKHIFVDYSDKDYVAFVSMNLLNQYGEIKSIISLNFLHENKLFAPPVLQKLQSNKSAVYYKDLEIFSNNVCELFV